MNKLIAEIYKCLVIVKYEHYLTDLYAHHKIWDDFHSNLHNITDEMVECIMGKGFKLEFSTLTVENISVYEYMTRIKNDINEMYPQQQSDVQSHLDDILNLINKNFYLLNLE